MKVEVNTFLWNSIGEEVHRRKGIQETEMIINIVVVVVDEIVDGEEGPSLTKKGPGLGRQIEEENTGDEGGAGVMILIVLGAGQMGMNHFLQQIDQIKEIREKKKF